MAYQSLDPIDLSTAAVGDSYTALPSGQYEGVSQVLLTNNSGFAFNISASSMGELPPLSAYSSAAYNAPPNGGALTATISGGQPGNQPPVQLGIMLAFGTSNFGGVSQAVGSVNIGSEVNITGNVTVDSITGTVDANITNANLPVSGSVDANITNATLTVDGTVSLTAGQVVEVTNQAGGSLTVAGTVDATVQNATIESGTVDISIMPIGTLLATLAPGSISYTIDAATVADNNTLTICGVPADLTHLGSISNAAAPNYPVPFGNMTSPGVDTGPVAVVVDVPANMGVVIQFTTPPANELLVYGSTGVELVAATVTNLPMATMGENTQALQVRPHLTTVPISVGSPAAGADWAFTLPYPARVRAIYASLTTDSTAGSRVPAFVVNLGQPYVVSFGANDTAISPPSWALYTVGPSSAVNLTAAIGAPQMAAPGTDGRIFATLPDFGVMATGQSVSSSTLGLQSGDQWSSINVLLEPA